MIKKILVPLDGSNRSEQGLLRAADVLRGSEGASILALRVLERPNSSQLFEPPDLDNAKKQEMQDINDYLDAVKEEFEFPGIEIETRTALVTDSIAETIIEQAELESADMIALTTHGRTGLKKLFFGSVAEKVIRLSHCSVLIVR